MWTPHPGRDAAARGGTWREALLLLSGQAVERFAQACQLLLVLQALEQVGGNRVQAVQQPEQAARDSPRGPALAWNGNTGPQGPRGLVLPVPAGPLTKGPTQRPLWAAPSLLAQLDTRGLVWMPCCPGPGRSGVPCLWGGAGVSITPASGTGVSGGHGDPCPAQGVVCLESFHFTFAGESGHQEGASPPSAGTVPAATEASNPEHRFKVGQSSLWLQCWRAVRGPDQQGPVASKERGPQPGPPRCHFLLSSGMHSHAPRERHTSWGVRRRPLEAPSPGHPGWVLWGGVGCWLHVEEGDLTSVAHGPLAELRPAVPST